MGMRTFSEATVTPLWSLLMVPLLSFSDRRTRHQRVKTWTRHVDIFTKDFLFVPVNQEWVGLFLKFAADLISWAGTDFMILMELVSKLNPSRPEFPPVLMVPDWSCDLGQGIKSRILWCSLKSGTSSLHPAANWVANWLQFPQLSNFCLFPMTPADLLLSALKSPRMHQLLVTVTFEALSPSTSSSFVLILRWLKVPVEY